MSQGREHCSEGYARSAWLVRSHEPDAQNYPTPLPSALLGHLGVLSLTRLGAMCCMGAVSAPSLGLTKQR